MSPDRPAWPLPVSILGLAVAYWVTGRLGLLLAIPPGYATAVWPASGIALAALLLYGYRLWPGILIGSFLVNVAVSFDGSSLSAIIRSVSLATSVGAGATLQALLGAFLVNRYVDLKSGLVTSRSVLGFLGWGGPVSCLLNATWGVSTLWFFGAISNAEYLFSWINWWAGDAIGVIVFLPLVYILLGRPAEVWRQRKVSVGVPLIVAVSVVTAFFFMASGAEQERIESQFQQRTKIVAESLEKQWIGYIESLYSIHGFITTSDETDRHRFKQFVSHGLERVSGIQALSWNPVISRQRRTAFEASMRESGSPDFQITERNEKGDLIEAGQRPKYVVVQYIEPHAGNEKALGFDVYSNPQRAKAMDMAMDTGLPVATARINLVQESGHQSGILIFLPVYQGVTIPVSIDERRKNLRGYAVGVFRIGDVFTTALQSLNIAHAKTFLIDESANPNENMLAAYRIFGNGIEELPLESYSRRIEDDLTWSTTIDVGGRAWRLVVAPTPEYLVDNRSWAAWAALAGGLMFAGLLGSFLLILTGRTIVDQRRAEELRYSNTELSNEIRHRQRVEEALRASEERFNLAIRAANEGLWDWDMQTDTVYYSPRWKSMLGYTDQELENAFGTWERLVDADGRSRVDALIEDCVKGEAEGFTVEFRMRHKQGHWVHILSNALVVRDDGGRPLRMVGTNVDVSERKAAEEAIVEKERAEASDRAKSEFLANMSHEIRTPLNGVLGLARIGERGTDPDEGRRLFAQISDSGEHLLRVVNDILDFSKIEAGRLTLEMRPLKLLALVRNSTTLAASEVGDKGLRLQVEVADDVPAWVQGDALRLEQILVNLLSNAVKFTERGEVRLDVSARDGRLQFRVRDTGIGMAEGQLARLFEPFVQADGSTTRRFGGTGLGLAISRNLAKMMGGTIEVSSRPGEGSEFVLNLPLEEAMPLSETPAPSATGQRLRGVRVLAAEDVDVNRLVLADLLDQEGAHVLFAANGRQLLDLLQEKGVNAFDVVLMDIQMPVMDGHEATRRVLDLSPNLPIIGLTAHALDAEKQRCLESGMVDHVTKPIDADTLVAAIRRQVTLADSVPQARATGRTTAADKGKTGQSIPEADGVIDWPAMRNRFQGRDSFIDKLLKAMLDGQRETPEKLRSAARDGDMEQVRFLAHSLKGMAGNLEAHGLRELAKRVEAWARENNSEAIAAADELATVLDQVLAAIADRKG